jgi:hypothetical protein
MKEDEAQNESDLALGNGRQHKTSSDILNGFCAGVLDQHDLARDAEEIRKLLTDEAGSCLCDIAFDGTCTCDVTLPYALEMDARERKWTAAKLLRPIETNIDDITSHLDEKETLMMFIEYWKIVASDIAEPTLQKYRRFALQYRHTRAFACKSWGISCPRPPRSRFAYESDMIVTPTPRPDLF